MLCTAVGVLVYPCHPPIAVEPIVKVQHNTEGKLTEGGSTHILSSCSTLGYIACHCLIVIKFQFGLDMIALLLVWSRLGWTSDQAVQLYMQQIVFWPLPPPSLQLHSFIFCILWVLPSPRTSGPEVAPMYYKYFVFILFFVFWALDFWNVMDITVVTCALISFYHTIA